LEYRAALLLTTTVAFRLSGFQILGKRQIVHWQWTICKNRLSALIKQAHTLNRNFGKAAQSRQFTL